MKILKRGWSFKEREMKDVERLTSLDSPKKVVSGHSRVGSFFNPPLSDFEIIEFQNLVMTPAVHYITTKNVSTGRLLINLFLSQLKHYHNVGCLTVEQNHTLSERVFDFYNFSHTQNSLTDSIELFCIENPYLNFIWIELTQLLQSQISASQVKKICELFAADEQTPVMVIRYEDESEQVAT